MRATIALLILAGLLVGAAPSSAGDEALERLLRAQLFNKEFEGYDFYWVSVEEERLQADGLREVMAVAGGKFLDNIRRMKVLVLIAGDRIIGGQILEHHDLLPCRTVSRWFGLLTTGRASHDHVHNHGGSAMRLKTTIGSALPLLVAFSMFVGVASAQGQADHAKEGIVHAKEGIGHVKEAIRHLEEAGKAGGNSHAKEAIDHAKDAVKHAEEAIAHAEQSGQKAAPKKK